VRLGRFALEGGHRRDAYIDVFGFDRVGNWEVYVMNGDGSAFTQLTDNAVEGELLPMEQALLRPRATSITRRP